MDELETIGAFLGAMENLQEGYPKYQMVKDLVYTPYMLRHVTQPLMFQFGHRGYSIITMFSVISLLPS